MPVAEPTEPAVDPGAPKNLMNNWMAEIAKIDSVDTKPEPKAEPKEEPSGKTTPGERPDPVAPPAKPAVGATAATEKAGDSGPKPAGTDNGGAKPDPDNKTAPSPKPDPAKAIEDKDDDYLNAPQPKDKKGWEKWTANRAKKEAQLKKDIQERDSKLAELTTKLTEVESKASVSPEPDPQIKAKIERLEAENKQLNDAVIRLKVTEHPRFKAHYDTQIDSAIARAKKHVGPDRAEQIEKILKLNDSDYRQSRLEEFMAETDSEMVKGRLNVVLEDLEKIQQDRDAEIKRIHEHNATLTTQEEAKAASEAEQGKKVREQAYSNTLKELSDPTKGFPPFHTRDGDDAWNQGVQKRIETAKGLYWEQNLKPEIRAKAAFFAAAMPDVIRHYQADTQSWKEKEAQYEAKLAELVAAQPKGGSTTTAKTEPGLGITKDMTPHQMTKNWADTMAEAMRGVGGA